MLAGATRRAGSTRPERAPPERRCPPRWQHDLDLWSDRSAQRNDRSGSRDLAYSRRPGDRSGTSGGSARGGGAHLLRRSEPLRPTRRGHGVEPSRPGNARLPRGGGDTSARDPRSTRTPRSGPPEGPPAPMSQAFSSIESIDLHGSVVIGGRTVRIDITTE